MKNKIIYLAILAAGFAACEPEFENEVTDGSYSAGDANFTTYVAVGNSLTAGYMDGTVSRVGQSYSYPSILAKQFALVGGGAFTQPSYEEDVNNLGGIMGLPGFNTRLVIDASAGGPEPIAGASTITLTPQAKAYNNMGVPGAKSYHLLAPGYGNVAGVALGQANPYFVRHATSPTATVLGDAMSLNPTFFTNWIGSNDVLLYAIAGGTGVDQDGNINPATYAQNDITDPNVFASAYNTIVTTLTSGGAKGVVATIPNVTSIPYFTTVPYNPLTTAALGGEAVVTQLNTELYGPMKQVLTLFGQGGRLNLLSATEPNPVIIVDETLPNLSVQLTGAFTAGGYPADQAAFMGALYGQARQATANDLILLPASSLLGKNAPGVPAPFNVYGVTYPLQDGSVLIPTEISAINTATTRFNVTIRQVAASKGVPVADMNAILNQLVDGLRVEDGQIYTANYFSTASLSTVLFSLDGVHPNARGYALIANEILKVINTTYNAKLPMVSPAYYPGATVLPTN
ncbi:G-D-S-L family lipolytic protein [Flavobacterium zepuense]|uniref:G-D-S-L family lipolytic protein n=1 Tax=Flavobacterium zepuense TaxID=2593302 RepID=A0A552UUL6_9FLAO|nr:G-D-S-L family lipolytic protein [Flavobacterium zepuense]TRW21899.1 G-D-S-L family lipolytic protein [Flavobacterium zepuense]